MSREKSLIEADIAAAEEKIKKLENEFLTPLRKELHAAEKAAYRKLLRRIRKDDPSDHVLLMERFDEFLELETLLEVMGLVHHTKPIDFLSDLRLSDVLNPGEEVDLSRRIYDLTEESTLTKLRDRFPNTPEEELKIKITETVHNTIKDRIVKFKFSW